MTLRFNFKSAAFAALLLSACGGDAEPQSPDDETIKEPSTAKDAGKDAGKDGGKKDAAASNSDDSDDSDDTKSDDTDDGDADDTGEPTGKADAGTSPTIDAAAPAADSGAKADAGKADAGASDPLSCEALTYASFGKTFFEKNCTSCHGAALQQHMVRLDSLADITKNKATVTREAITSKKMPPPPTKLSADDLTKLQKFLECGPK